MGPTFPKRKKLPFYRLLLSFLVARMRNLAPRNITWWCHRYSSFNQQMREWNLLGTCPQAFFVFWGVSLSLSLSSQLVWNLVVFFSDVKRLFPVLLKLCKTLFINTGLIWNMYTDIRGKKGEFMDVKLMSKSLHLNNAWNRSAVASGVCPLQVIGHGDGVCLEGVEVRK